jgi:hypothetical protein
MHVVVLERFLHDKGKVGRFGAIAIGVLGVIPKTLHGIVKGCLDEADVFADTGKVSELQWRAVLLDDVHQRHIIKKQLMFSDFKLFLGKFESLLYQLAVALHLALSGCSFYSVLKNEGCKNIVPVTGSWSAFSRDKCFCLPNDSP